MKNTFWIFKTEFFQNKLFFSLAVLASFLLGIFLIEGNFTIKKIESLTAFEKWNADVIVLPKGISISDLKNEILSGYPTRFLPSVLFESTKSIIGDRFSLSIILPLGNTSSHVEILQKGDPIGLSWLDKIASHTHVEDKNISIVPWKEQSSFQTSEWGYNVAAAMFASGPYKVMKSFQELIDRKTIGQAFFVSDEEAKNKIQQEEMFFYLKIISALIGFLFLSIIFLLLHILKMRFKNIYQILNKNGFSSSTKYQLNILMLLIYILLPFIFGISTGLIFNPFI